MTGESGGQIVHLTDGSVNSGTPTKRAGRDGKSYPARRTETGPTDPFTAHDEVDPPFRDDAPDYPAGRGESGPDRGDSPDPAADGEGREAVDVPVDEDGRPLPEPAQAAFACLPDLRRSLRAIDDLRREVERLGKSPLGLHMHWQSVQAHLGNARNGLHQSRPAHVCPYCQVGKPLCRACRGAGWVTSAMYRAAPKE